MLTDDIKEYRRIYYRKHREYLLGYSKWYYSKLKFMKGLIVEDEMIIKPFKEVKEKKKKKNKETGFIKSHGTFILVF